MPAILRKAPAADGMNKSLPPVPPLSGHYRKRTSLVEALNNSIELPPRPEIDTPSQSNTGSVSSSVRPRPSSCEIKSRNIFKKIFRSNSCKVKRESMSVPPSKPMEKITSLPGTPVRRQQIMRAEHSHVVVERIYCVRQVLRQVTEEYYAFGGPDAMRFYPRERPQAVTLRARGYSERNCLAGNEFYGNSFNNGFPQHIYSQQRFQFDQQLDLPPRLMRAKNHKRGSMKRSKSQPMASPERGLEDDEGGFTEIGNSGARANFYIENASNTSSSQDHGPSYRSSMHSTSSSLTTSSMGSTENHEDANSNQSTMTLGEALWDHVTIQPDELPFRLGDVIQVCDWSHPELWFGSLGDKSGWFPSSYVRLLSSSPEKRLSTEGSSVDSDQPQPEVPSRSRRLRSRIVQELITTERDYLLLLRNLVEGFLNQARKRTELFPEEKLGVIFGNLEAILRLHEIFLVDLENDYNKDTPGTSCIGHCFLRHHDSFTIYADYCNNRPLSCAELASLTQDSKFHQFFEACRLLCGLPKLPLEGFLLTPVQRICKYPLQLAELVKATPTAHPDFAACREALDAMRTVATRINEGKRRIESLQKMAVWQGNVHGWTGTDLVDESNSLIHSGEFVCRCVVSGQSQWTKDCQSFVFDRTLVLCKKDKLKRNQLILRQRICLIDSQLTPIPDGKDNGMSVKHALKLSLPDSDRYYVLMCRGRKAKDEWLRAFEEAKELSKLQPVGKEEKRIALAALTPTVGLCTTPRLPKQKSFQYQTDCSPGRKRPTRWRI